MELIIILGISIVLWFVLSGNYKTKMQDPQTLRSVELEDSIVELKKKSWKINLFKNMAKNTITEMNHQQKPRQYGHSQRPLLN